MKKVLLIAGLLIIAASTALGVATYTDSVVVVREWFGVGVMPTTGGAFVRSAKAYIKGDTAAEKTVIIKGATSQSADLLEIQSSAAADLFSVSSAGAVSSASTVTAKNGVFQSADHDAVALIAKGYSTAQMGDLFQVQNSAGSTVLEANSDGTMNFTPRGRIAEDQTYFYRWTDGGGGSAATTGVFTCKGVDCSAIKNYGAQFNFNHPSTAPITGDSREATLKLGGNNHAANDTNYKQRSIEASIANRSGGTLAEVDGIDMGVSNRGTAPALHGANFTVENYGTTTTDIQGLHVDLRNEGTKATAEYGILVTNTNNSLGTACDAGYALSDSGANIGWYYGVDLNGATIQTADVRLSKADTLTNSATNVITLSSSLIIKSYTSDPCGTIGASNAPAIFFNATAKELCQCIDGTDIRIKDYSTACF